MLLIFAIFAASSVHATFFGVSSSLVKDLVLLDISRRGKPAVLRDIMNARDPRYIDYDRCMYEVPVVLRIDAMFHKKDSATDQLTKNIFESIEEREARSGYIPGHIEKRTKNAFYVTMPTNSLGNGIRYFWLEKNGNIVIYASATYRKQLQSVRIDAQLTDKIELQKIVDAHKEEM
jgi:hypothetical protein